MVTKGPLARGERLCSSRAISSLPVPVSPVISTGAADAAARPISFQMANIADEVPTRPERAGGADGMVSACARLRCLTARSTVARSAGKSNGLVR